MSYITQLPTGVGDRTLPVGAVYVLDPVTGLPAGQGAAAIDYEIRLIEYVAKNAATGYSVGDRIVFSTIFNVTSEPPINVGSNWFNASTLQDLAAAPPVGDLGYLGSQAGALEVTQQAVSTGITNLNAATGTKADAAAGNFADPFSLIALTKLIGATLYNVYNLLNSRIPTSLGAKASAASLSVVPATDANQARELYSAVTILNTATSPSSGTAFATLATVTCSMVDIINTTGVDLEVRRGGAGLTLVIQAGQSRMIQGITNANQIQLRRVDLVATTVIVPAEAYTV